MEYKMHWLKSGTIQRKHSNLPVRQIYCWIATQDGKVIIVSRDGIKWQFPGGHPNVGETFLQTLIREIGEETGLNLKNEASMAIFFGYYIVEELENDEIVDKYSQVRFFLRLNLNGDDLNLQANENPEDNATAQMKFVKAVSVIELFDKIPWVKDSKEYISAEKLLAK